MFAAEPNGAFGDDGMRERQGAAGHATNEMIMLRLQSLLYSAAVATHPPYRVGC